MVSSKCSENLEIPLELELNVKCFTIRFIVHLPRFLAGMVWIILTIVSHAVRHMSESSERLNHLSQHLHRIAQHSKFPSYTITHAWRHLGTHRELQWSSFEGFYSELMVRY